MLTFLGLQNAIINAWSFWRRQKSRLSLSDERDDSEKVSVHEDAGESEKREHIIFKKFFY